MIRHTVKKRNIEKQKHPVSLTLKILLSIVVFVVCLFSVPTVQWIAASVPIPQYEKAVIGETEVTIEVVDDEEGRIQGLSGRERIDLNHGMLFVFDMVEPHGIWMKQMRFALDIIWLNEHSEVIFIEEHVLPKTFPKVFEPNKPAKFVLEFNAGFVEKNQIKIGDRFILP